jgi:hypothetical protein
MSTKSVHRRCAKVHRDKEDTLTALQMLQYYESHLVFTQSDGVLIGGDDDESMESVY